MKHIIIKFYSGSRIKTVNGTILEENERFIKCLVGKTTYTLDKETDYVSFIWVLHFKRNM